MNSCCKPYNAIARIKSNNNNFNIDGTVKFYQKRGFVLIEAKITGLPENNSGFFGFHIHEGSDCKGELFENTKGHYNPTDASHPNHSGDLPSLLLCGSGAYMTVATDRFSVGEIIGRTVVIHSNADDFTTQPSGNSGTKIACGIIEKY
ncbi:MAG: superoxide dismutase family protein [Acutalibacteraceae bacterium]|nr:superoxide dismutase family protein [Acutalibacteraceae bacterium]